METNIQHLEKASLVQVSGSIDALTAADVITTFDGLAAGGHQNLVLDLSGVDFMSSAGLRAILSGWKACHQFGGDLRLAAAQPGVSKILKMSGFLSILKFFDSAEDALASF